MGKSLSDEEVQKIYDERWKSLVENEDGTLNKDAIMNELCDYSGFMKNVSKFYCEMTNGKLSKPNYLASVMIAELEDNYYDKKNLKNDIYDILVQHKEDWENDHLVSQIADYFQIDMDEPLR